MHKLLFLQWVLQQCMQPSATVGCSRQWAAGSRMFTALTWMFSWPCVMRLRSAVEGTANGHTVEVGRQVSTMHEAAQGGAHALQLRIKFSCCSQ